MSIPFNFTTYSDRVRQDTSKIPLSTSTELSNIFEEATREGLLISPAINAVREAIAGQDSPEISAQEANERFGIPGELEFKESLPEAVANIRLENHRKYVENKQIHDIADNDNDFLDNTRNTLAFLATATFLDPTTYLVSPIKGLASLASVAKGAGFLNKIPMASKILAGTEKALMNPALLGGPIRTGIVRGLVDEGITQGLTEAALFDQAQKNGYDYDVLMSVGAVLFGGAVRGAGEVFTSTRPGTVVNHLFDIDNYTQTKALSKQSFDGLVSRVADDLANGSITDLSVAKAVMKLDSEANLTELFQQRVFQGLDNIFTRTELDNLTRQDIFTAKPLMGMLRNLQDSGLLERGVRNIEDIPVPAKFQGLEIKSLQKVESLLKENNDLLKRFGNQKSKLAREIVAQDEYLKAAKNQLVKDNINDIYLTAERQGFTNGKQIKDMSLDEYKQTYSELIENIRKKRTSKSLDSLLNKKSQTRIDIANLHRLIDPEVSNFELDDLFDLDIGDLEAAHAKHRYFDEALNEMSELEARNVIAQYAENPIEKEYINYVEAENRMQETRVRAEKDSQGVVKEAEARVNEFLNPKETPEGAVVDGDPIAERYNISKEIQDLAEYKEADDFFTREKKYVKGVLEGLTCFLGN